MDAKLRPRPGPGEQNSLRLKRRCAFRPVRYFGRECSPSWTSHTVNESRVSSTRVRSSSRRQQEGHDPVPFERQKNQKGPSTDLSSLRRRRRASPRIPRRTRVLSRATKGGGGSSGDSQLPQLDDPQTDVLIAYLILGSTLVAGNAPGLPGFVGAPLPYFSLLAVSAVFIGSKRGILNKEVEMISFKQGAAAPIALSFSLFGFYLLLKYSVDIETFINGYFFFLEFVSGCFSLWIPMAMVGKLLDEQPVVNLDLSWLVKGKEGEESTEFGVKPSLILVGFTSIALAALNRFAFPENFTLNNIEACFIVITWLELLGVNSFKTAVTLLFGLLFYDVFWVFGSGKVLNLVSKTSNLPAILPENGSVMADVAMSPLVSVPTKLLFPRESLEASAFNFSLLGMGDILIPGLLVGLLLRYDTNKGDNNKGDQSYFKASLVAYACGLLASFLASFLSGEGQPALLYLVPLTVGSAVFVGLQKQELKDLWSFEIKKKEKVDSF